MDVIKAVESFQYFHSVTGQNREEWMAWRVQACEEWMLDKAILGKECEENGCGKGEPDCSGYDQIVYVAKRDCGRCGGIGQHRLPNEEGVPGEDGALWQGVSGAGDSPGKRD